ncbi:TetR/AcrR family transcriptional repressor of nem operon [Luteibacter sp. Sphag1AF]|uniref:TetR/AcrR family transcriptional regulator n=1 Tax=Luteibacter sp. Sphag1AF TaxID=2587031 RepID=UPI00161A38C8|nr:TetR/AcrR family transcriptional regulator [Luteibacter sp. Sphag1AF]MBB3226592.1 TetR/AcrR family transcriptional repressor of nem operon [Luteibacter sp. Sphag1AF]
MRYDKGHKEQTRQRILDAAASRFRAEGIEAVGVVSLMNDVGLTQGGFYNHFSSKEDLVRETLTGGFCAARDALRALVATGDDGLATLVDHYLSTQHRDHPESGCAAAALAPEIGRRTAATREVFTGGVKAMVELIGDQLPEDLTREARQARALAVYGSLVGSLALARAVDDEALSEQMLKSGRQAAMALGRPAAG